MMKFNEFMERENNTRMNKIPNLEEIKKSE